MLNDGFCRMTVYTEQTTHKYSVNSSFYYTIFVCTQTGPATSRDIQTEMEQKFP